MNKILNNKALVRNNYYSKEEENIVIQFDIRQRSIMFSLLFLFLKTMFSNTEDDVNSLPKANLHRENASPAIRRM